MARRTPCRLDDPVWTGHTKCLTPRLRAVASRPDTWCLRLDGAALTATSTLILDAVMAGCTIAVTIRRTCTRTCTSTFRARAADHAAHRRARLRPQIAFSMTGRQTTA